MSLVKFAANPYTAGVTMTTLSQRRKGSTVVTVVPNYTAKARAALNGYRKAHAARKVSG